MKRCAGDHSPCEVRPRPKPQAAWQRLRRAVAEQGTEGIHLGRVSKTSVSSKQKKTWAHPSKTFSDKVWAESKTQNSKGVGNAKVGNKGKRLAPQAKLLVDPHRPIPVGFPQRKAGQLKRHAVWISSCPQREDGYARVKTKVLLQTRKALHQKKLHTSNDETRSNTHTSVKAQQTKSTITRAKG